MVLRKFVDDRRGQFAMMTAIAVVPILGGLALAIDYTEMNRQRTETLNALDAAGVATARYIVSGATDDEAKAYAKDFFEANLHAVNPADTTLNVVLPQNNTGGGTLKLSANFSYQPYFFPAFTALVNHTSGSTEINIDAASEVKLKNTLEVALVLDNSGSMDDPGTGSGEKRIDLLKKASKQLIDTLAKQAGAMKQISKPVQVSLVPFAASVNVGPDNSEATWMDTRGISPIHHENFDWSTFTATNKKVTLSGGSYYKRGSDWGTEKDKIVTRFTLFKDMKHKFRPCKKYDYWGSCTEWGPEQAVSYTWGGCVEARPNPYNVNDAAPATGTPATMFVPMFAPDETDKVDGSNRAANNNWLADMTSSNSNSTRQRYMPKYYAASALSAGASGVGAGPNTSCSTSPIATLADVSTTAGVDKIKTAIDAMAPLGATNVPEGLAWGWRTVSSAEPFTDGRPDNERGNDKVVIVLTDGANTYYAPDTVRVQPYTNFNNNGSSTSGGNDLAGTKALYSAYGYLGSGHYSSSYSNPRLFQGTTSAIGKSDYSNKNYSNAMNEQMAAVCTNAKTAGVIVMTIALDLDPTKGTAEQKAMTKAQIDGLTNCASMSRFRNEKLFWNTDGGDLDETFKKIADELSNLRIVS